MPAVERQAPPEPRAPHQLDKVIWNALTTQQRRLAVGDERARRFPVPIAPFAAVADTDPACFAALHALIETHGSAALVTPDALRIPPEFAVVRYAPLLQMIWQGDDATAPACGHVRLTESDVPDMLALTAEAQPGPFGPRTIELGDYIGVRRAGRLVAMAGERMRLDGYTEISAVCVAPAFRGEGLAAALMKVLIAAIRERGATPFLHVLEENRTAIALYRRLGFVERRTMHLTVLAAEAEAGTL